MDTAGAKMPMIEIRDVHTRFGDSVVHDGVSLEVHEGRDLRPRRRERMREIHAAARAHPAAAAPVGLDPGIRT